MDVVGTNAFELSRVYGQGWKAARKSLAGGCDEDAARALTLNPYRGIEERARWAKGFEDGLVGRAGPHNVGRSGWRPTTKKE
jgi:hypothetical protein